jgi:stage V sporulation protein AD
MLNRIGKRTIYFNNKPSIGGHFSIVGYKEGEGPLKEWFDKIVEDAKFGEDSWEKAESKFILTAVNGALSTAGLTSNDIDYYLGGDLLNQCIATNYTLRELDIPFFGLYGACSTMAESLILGSILIDGGFAQNLICATTSHFCTAERQYRYPLEYGGQRPLTSQWTVTGAGASILTNKQASPYISYATVGKVIDLGIKDANNMGSAMAPAACDTILAFFSDTGFSKDDYDLIITGDLGEIGLELLNQLLIENDLDISDKLDDCGCMIFDNKKQDTHCGGSGCGCSASVLNSNIIKRLKDGSLSRVLFIATGALMSPTTTQQGETIPSVAHLLEIRS